VASEAQARPGAPHTRRAPRDRGEPPRGGHGPSLSR